MPSKEHRRSISVRRDTYEAVQPYCQQRGQSISDLLESVLRPLVGLPPVDEVRAATRPRPAPVRHVKVAEPVVEAPPVRAAKERQVPAVTTGALRAELPSRDKVTQPVAPTKVDVPARVLTTRML